MVCDFPDCDCDYDYDFDLLTKAENDTITIRSMRIFFTKQSFDSHIQKTIEPFFQKRLNEFKRDIRAYIDPLTGEESTSKYTANEHTDYKRAVQELANKYDNKSSWGCSLAANIIDFRAAVCVSSGPQYKLKKAAEIKPKDDEGKQIGAGIKAMKAEALPGDGAKELEFVRGFFEANGIDHETPQDWGREAEIEARLAVQLSWDDTKKQVIADHLPWLKYYYDEKCERPNSKTVSEITWKETTFNGEKVPAGSVSEDELVYRRFGGRTSATDPMGKVIRCMTEIEYIAQAFRDWREIDRLYASPIPVFECGSQEEAENMADAIREGLNWKIKKAFSVYGKFVMVGPDMTGISSLEKEIIRNACFIAGETGYPLQFILPDMLSNRSTSENIMESAMTQTASERAIWIGFYDELITKAMGIYNEKSGMTQLDPTKISVSISLMTQAQWDRLVNFWIPAFREKLVSREATLPQIPDFNVDEELSRAEKAEAEETARIAEQLDRMKEEAEAEGAEGAPPPQFNKSRREER